MPLVDIPGALPDHGDVWTVAAEFFVFQGFLTTATRYVIPGRCEASKPESRDSGSGANAPSRNDGE
jgi:hypothetical protein